MHADDDTCREYALPGETATLALGALLADAMPKDLRPAAVVYLEGDLGAGKTTLVRGLLRKAGIAGSVKSPTYTLVEPHVISGLNLYHFDFYRFTVPEEFLDAGLDEYFADSGLCLVEWPDRARPYVPASDVRIRLELDGAGRHAHVDAASDRGRSWVSRLPPSLDATSCALPPPA
ncbi:MAG: tRNA (adenosine(37)-N6)-threonylcarbamoyltransferase complex ATPase subunit type 1 TsaE [Pseudomonadota bacterium]